MALGLKERMKEKIINHNFYCIYEKPTILFNETIKNYLKLLKYLTKIFYEAFGHSLELYENDKITASPNFIVQPFPVKENHFYLPPSSQNKIKWNGSAKDFAETFANLINSRKLYLNRLNEPDTDPIVKLLHQYFFIPNAKKAGQEITASSLSTYFKEYNSEQANKQ